MFEFVVTWSKGLTVKGFNDSEQAYQQANEWDALDKHKTPNDCESGCNVLTWQEWQEVCLCNEVDPVEALQSSLSLEISC